MSTTRIRQHIKATRSEVYRALLDSADVAHWRVPDGMRAEVHEWDAREGGTLRISLTYEQQTGAGKSTEHTDSYHGRFITLVPDERVVEEDEFEAADPGMQGAMRSTITLTDASDGGTDVEATHEGLPPALSASDNELGWRMALAKLAALVERRAAESDA